MRLQTDDVKSDLERLAQLLDELHGLEIDVDATGKNSRPKAEVSRNLQYAAHLCDKIKVGIAEEFWILKGRVQPQLQHTT